MKIISGKISCTKKKTIQPGSTVYVQAVECFVDKNPELLGQIIIPSASTFPVLFEMSFDEKPIIQKKFTGMYLIFVKIQKKDKTQFLNDGDQFVFEKTQVILDKIDLEVEAV
jgi:uncharacterized lipoprotein YbaY